MGEAITAQLALFVMGIGCHCLLPENAFSEQNAWRRRLEGDGAHMLDAIADDRHELLGFTSRAHRTLSLTSNYNIQNSALASARDIPDLLSTATLTC